MKWIAVTSSVVKNELYELWDGNKKILSLVYNATLRTARIDQQDIRRMFIIEQEAGFLRSRTLFKNEYGVPVGACSDSTWTSSGGFVELDRKKFYYNIAQHGEPELSLTHGRATLLKCGYSQAKKMVPPFLMALACIFVPNT